MNATPLLTALRRCKDAAPVLCVLDGPCKGVLLSRNEIEWLERTGATVLYGNKAELQAQLDAAPVFVTLNPLPAVLSDQAETDRLYARAQDVARAVTGDLVDGLEPTLRAEASGLCETVALQAGDHYAPLALVHAAMHRVVPNLAVRPVLLMGLDQPGCLGLQALLAQDGIDSQILPVLAPRPGIRHALRRTRRAVKHQLRRAFGIGTEHLGGYAAHLNAVPEGTPSPARVVERLCGVIRQEDPLCMVSPDPIYLQALGAILDGAPRQMGVIVAAPLRTGPVQDALARHGPPDADRTAFLEYADLYLQDSADRQALQARIDAWMQDTAAHRRLSANTGRPVGFLLSRVGGTLNLLAYAIVAARIYREALHRVRPGAILLMPQRFLIPRIMADVARTSGIATFDLPVGTMARSRIQWRTGCDYICVADTGSLAIQTGFFGLAESRVRIIGAPRLDAGIADLRDQANGPRPRHSLFLALQHLDPGHNLKLITACATATAELGGSLTVGLHPRELDLARDILLAHCAAQGSHVRVADGPSLPELVHHETCVTFFSFVAYEAYALGARVIALNLSGEAWPVRLSESGFAEEACSTEELLGLLQTPPRQSGVDPRNQVLRDGQSVRRLHEDMARLPVISDAGIGSGVR